MNLLQQFKLAKESSTVEVFLNNNNLNHWIFKFQGVKDSVYEDGEYYGELTFTNYPEFPPVIILKTPNGRFIINFPICLSISIFHTLEWKSDYPIISILEEIPYFMLDELIGVGYLHKTDSQRRDLALYSKQYNKNLVKKYIIIDQ